MFSNVNRGNIDCNFSLLSLFFVTYSIILSLHTTTSSNSLDLTYGVDRSSDVISKDSNSSCFPGKPQCEFNEPYVLIKGEYGVAISFEVARNMCRNTYGTELARLYPEFKHLMSYQQQYDLMRETCPIPGSKFNCWTGGQRDTANTDIWRFYNNTGDDPQYAPFVIYDDEASNYDLNISQIWACDSNLKCQPDQCQKKGCEQCLALFSSWGYRMSDWDCGGGTSDDYLVQSVLCNNPGFDLDIGCTCECELCHVFGDPHLITFDSTFYHPMGNCTYFYMTPCETDSFDEDFPFDISGCHEECFNWGDGSCLRALYVRLYSPQDTSTPVAIVVVEHVLDQTLGYWSTSVRFLPCETCLEPSWSGIIPSGSEVSWYRPTDEKLSSQPWCFSVIYPNDIVNGSGYDADHYILRFWTKARYETVRIHFRDLDGVPEFGLYLSSAKIYASTCYSGSSTTCGLCGYFDGTASNDFVVRYRNGTIINPVNGNPDFENPISTENVHQISDKDAWYRSQVFREAWINTEGVFGELKGAYCSSPSLIDPDSFCNTTQFTTLCPSQCVCVDENGVEVVTPIEDSESILATCTFDFSQCFGCDLEDIDEKYNIVATYSMTTAQYFRTYANNSVLIQQFLDYVGRGDCHSIIEDVCCSDAFCESPWTIDLDSCENPTSNPTHPPTIMPIILSTDQPSSSPTPFPTTSPTDGPTDYPSLEPTPFPTTDPIRPPTLAPSIDPTPEPTDDPTPFPTNSPTDGPTDYPTPFPTAEPTDDPTPIPTNSPTDVPTDFPSPEPTAEPTPEPIADVTPFPTNSPTDDPTDFPTPFPTAEPTDDPTPIPTNSPTDGPTDFPTPEPTADPTTEPTPDPTPFPTDSPTDGPTDFPSPEPTNDPTTNPTNDPSADPTADPTNNPTIHPIADPTKDPTTVDPTTNPSVNPTDGPTSNPIFDDFTDQTDEPTIGPTSSTTANPTAPCPLEGPTVKPTQMPKIITKFCHPSSDSWLSGFSSGNSRQRMIRDYMGHDSSSEHCQKTWWHSSSSSKSSSSSSSSSGDRSDSSDNKHIGTKWWHWQIDRRWQVPWQRRDDSKQHNVDSTRAYNDRSREDQLWKEPWLRRDDSNSGSSDDARKGESSQTDDDLWWENF